MVVIHPTLQWFEPLRPHLVGVAYRMLGTHSDAEDAVQTAWMRIAMRTHADALEHPRAWWTRVVVRVCLDVRAARARDRLDYVGCWIPEPLADAQYGPMVEAAAAPREVASLRLALLRLMHELSALELAAYLLREVFDDDYADIAAALDRDEAAVRQLVRRARAHLNAGNARFSVDRAELEALLTAFATTAAAGDVDGLRRMLSSRCVARSDGGGKASTATREVVGDERVAKLYVGTARRVGAELVPRLVDVNGLPALALVAVDGRCDTVLQLVVADGLIAEVLVVRNPDKLRALELGQARGG